MDWLGKVFPDEGILKYFGKIAGSCIKGKNLGKIFLVLIGNNNSKFMIKRLFEATFGSYSITFSTTLLGSKRNKRNHAPERAVRAARVGWIQEQEQEQEPDSYDLIDSNMLMNPTDGDSICTKDCNEKEKIVELTYKLFLLCKYTPIIPVTNPGTRKLARILPCSETECPKFDLYSDHFIPKLSPAFMWYIVQMFPLYKKRETN